MNIYIKVGSITNAQRARSVLVLSSTQAEINRTENPKPGDGCGYMIRIKKMDKEKVLSILKKNGIRVLGEEVH